MAPLSGYVVRSGQSGTLFPSGRMVVPRSSAPFRKLLFPAIEIGESTSKDLVCLPARTVCSRSAPAPLLLSDPCSEYPGPQDAATASRIPVYRPVSPAISAAEFTGATSTNPRRLRFDQSADCRTIGDIPAYCGVPSQEHQPQACYEQHRPVGAICSGVRTHVIKSKACAYLISSASLLVSNLRLMFLRCCSTVRREMNSFSAMAGLAWPVQTSLRTSRSRLVS